VEALRAGEIEVGEGERGAGQAAGGAGDAEAEAEDASGEGEEREERADGEDREGRAKAPQAKMEPRSALGDRRNQMPDDRPEAAGRSAPRKWIGVWGAPTSFARRGERARALSWD
jgi:hypothetical protein